MKRQHFLKSTLCLLLALVCNVAWAQDFVTPETGKRYKIKGLHATNPWLTATVENGGIDVSANEADAGIYLRTESGLQAVATGKYMGTNDKSQISLVDAETEVTLEAASDGMMYIATGGRYLHNNQADYTREGDKSATSQNMWGFVLVEEAAPETTTYTVNITGGESILIGGDTYTNGSQYAAAGAVAKGDITAAAPTGKFAVVNIDEEGKTINVYFAAIPTQTTTATYQVPVLYPAQQTVVGDAQATSSNGAHTLWNNVLAASFVEVGGDLYFAGSEAMDLVAGTEPFTVAFGAGDVVPASAMTLKNVALQELTGKNDAIGGAEHYDGKALVANYTYTYKESTINIVWRAILRDGSHYLRTEMELTGVNDVDMFNIIPMIYNVDTKAAGSTPAVVGNTRGAVLMSNKIFAGLETPTAYNTVGDATGDEDNWTLTTTVSPVSLAANAWTQMTEAEAEEVKRVEEATGATYPNLYAYKQTNITLEEGQKVEVKVEYKSGSNKLYLGGVDLLSSNGDIAANDYHVGYTGSVHDKNVFTFIAPNAGTYTVRAIIHNASEAINATSELTTKIYTPKEGVVINTDIVGIQGRWSRNTTLAAGETWKVGAVVGLIAQDGTETETDIHKTQKRRSFLAYSERERAVPWRAMSMYLAWYELQINRNNAAPGSEHIDNTVESEVLDVMDHWKSDFYDRYGIAPEIFIVDDGWDKYGEWTFHPGFPDELRNMSAAAKEMGSSIGAWLGPVGGYGQSGNYRRDYWSDKGGMQLSNPRYYQAFKDAAYNLVKNQGDNYVFFKFDGISAQFSATGPDAGDTGNENAEGIIRLEQYVREELREDIFFNTSVGTWASPFWYQITDATWRQENDHDRTGNNSTKRENWITYRDRLVYQNYVKNSPICPINTLMTHGFILTKFGPPASDERDYLPVRNELRAAFLCGSGMVELYNDYDLMNSINGGALWADLAECIAWQKRNADVLPDAHWVGGNPWDGSKCNVYGWAAWNGTKSSLALRNGGNDAQTYTFTLRNALNIPETIDGSIILRSAFGEQAVLEGLTEGTAINIDTELTVTLPGSSVYGFEGISSTATVTPVSNISLTTAYDITKVYLNKTLVVKATVNNGATFPALTWSSSNPEVATVVGGLVQPLKEGEVTITATAKDGSGHAQSIALKVVPAVGEIKTGTPENGKQYYIYADTYSGGKYVNRYLQNNNGTLKMNAALDETDNSFLWTCIKNGDKYNFQNVGNPAKYLAHKNVADAAYNFTLGKANANHEGTTIWSDGVSRYMVAKNDGSTFDQSTSTYNQTSSDWCTDYVFVEYVAPAGNTLSITANYAAGGEILVNKTAATLPFTKYENKIELPVTLTATANNPYTFLGFFQGEVNTGTEVPVTSLDEAVAYEARYSLDIFSADLNNLVPVRVSNSRDKGYAIKMNAAANYSDKAVNSGVGTYEENEIWYLVGNASSFKMYSRVAGTTLALKLAGTSRGSAATLAAEGTELCLVAQADGSYAICPKGAEGQSFNMHGGAGADIKLYDTSDGGSKWMFKRVDVSKVLTLSYNTQLEGGYAQNYKIGELSITIDGTTSKSMLEKTTVPASRTCYLPEGAEFGISTGLMCHGWTMDINGSASIPTQALPEGGLTVNVNIAVDKDNKYQYLYYSPGPGGHPYRIPAIATTANGYVFAINDFRPCGNDIGYGEVDLVMRHSTAAGSDWDGHSWTESVTIADGQGDAYAANDTAKIWQVGFGDPAIVADRESNQVLVLSVCGNQTCRDGTFGEENPNPNRMARLYITYDENTKQWNVGEPEEVTYDVYRLFENKDGEAYAASMFIGAGRIAQSSKVKVGTHYRIYCAVWTVTKTQRQHHNYALYSDDFGKTWHVLGELGYDNCPAKLGNEPKCEELPDGSVLLSSRKGYGRYFNVFRYTDVATGEGYWEGEVSTDQVGDLKWGNNSTNGEPLRIGNVLFQSAPTGNNGEGKEDRSDVAVFYKVLSNDPADYTPTKLSSGWTKIQISDKNSAYSSMAILPDGNLGLYYEENPGGYSMVYVPLDLKKILPAEVYAALSALPPTYASEMSPVWHNIKFGATGNALYDQGAGNNVATSTDAEADAAMWNIVGTQEQFYLVSKLGNYLAYDKASNRYTTTSDKKQKVALTLKENIKGSWEIMRKGASKSLCEVTVKRSTIGEVTEGTICGDANQVLFDDKTPEVYEPNIFSTEEEPVWFQVQFKAGGAYITDKDAGNNLQTAASTPGDAQCWQFIGSPENFYMKSKVGNYVYFNNSRFATSSTEKTALDLTKNAAEGYYEIGRTTTTSTFNQWGGAGAGKELGEWTAGDSNNPLCFMAEPLYPKFSNNENSYWYYIQFGNGESVIEDKGADADVKTAKLSSGNNNQLWKFTGSVTNCQIINKASGRYLVHDGTIKAKTSADGTGFKIVVTGNANFADMFEIQKAGSTANSNAFNMNGGAGTDKSIAFYNYGDGGNPLAFMTEASMAETIINEYTIAESNAAAPAEKLTLWYTQSAPATGVANTWMEYSLPIGNGQFGASLFGGVARDEILFNEKTLWSGGPGEYGYYLPFGSVYIDDLSGDFENASVQNYYRDLNLKTATGTMSYENAEGVKFTRQYIASNPDKAVVTKITASEAGKLSFRITMVSGKPTVKATTTYKNGYAQFSGKLQTVSYNATLKVVAKNGYVSTGTEGIIVEEADEVLLVLMGSTDFVGNDASHINGRAPYLADDNKAIVDAVAQKGWDAVYADHVADHQEYFNRVDFQLDGVENDLPTNELITAYNAATGARNLMLEQLYYNYGRYLSIASSRGIDLPNNLQGIWNNTCTPPWHSDIHANINVQMNYWPVSAGNLDEMYEPFLNYIINEAAQPEWHSMASNAVTELNNQLGSTTAVRDDAWTCYTENNIFGGYSTFQTNYVIANAWYVTHMWQHYRYTLDKEYLKRAFPAMKGSSLFWADRMIKVDVTDEDGTVVDYCYECPNEYSPEHGPGSENAVAHAQQIAWESIDNTIKAADVLGGVAAGIISQEDYDLLKERLEKMDRGLAIEEYEQHGGWPAERNGIKAGDKILREWKYSRFYASGDQGHRHMSHLMALYPFGQLTPANEELFAAAINSMKLRGDESTGWSMGWKINLWARALMGDRSHAILRKALKHSTSYGTDQGQGGIYYNLFDSHAPFQIDGNFGAASGVQEMLMQSHTEVIDILPALPAEWSKGSVKGLKAVGDFTVDIEWEGNQARKVTITNNQGQPCYVKCVGLSAAVVTVNGNEVELGEETTHGGLPCYQIASNAGEKIVIDLSNALQVDKTALETLIEETEELLNECYNYYPKVTLQTTDASGAYYLSTNADHNAFNDNKDGQGIGALIDNDDNTFLHTNWNNNATGITDKHHLQVSLGDNNAVSLFKFAYKTRKAENDFIKTMEIYGSNGGDFELITTLTDLPVGNTSESKLYESPIIETTKAYSTLRFVVTATNSNKKAGDYVFFHLAKFELMPYAAEPVVNFPNSVLIPTTAAKATAAIATAEEAVNAIQTVTEYTASLAALQAAYDELVAAMASSNLPVLLSLNTDKPYVYKIGIKRGDTKVLQFDYTGTPQMVAVADYSEGNKNQGWYFTKGSADGKVFIHPYLGGGDVLSAKSTSNSPAAVWATPKGTMTHEEWTIPVVNSENGTYNIKAGDGSNYFSNNGGVSNKMGFWSGDHTTDEGSLFVFTRVEFDGELWKNTLNAYVNTFCTKESYPEGNTLGYYKNGAAYTEARAEAVTLLADEAAAESNLKEAYFTLRNANNEVVLIAPEAGKFYRIKNNGGTGYLSSGTGTGRVQFVENIGEAASSIFYYTDSKLLAYENGMYLANNENFLCYTETVGEAAGTIITFKGSPVAGKLLIEFNNGGRSFYSAGLGNSDAAGAGQTGDNYRFTVEEVTSLPVSISKVGYSTLYAPVALSVPENVAAYVGELTGDVLTLTKVEDVIPANTGVVLKGSEATHSFDVVADDVDAIKDNALDGTVAKIAAPTDKGTIYTLQRHDTYGVAFMEFYDEETKTVPNLNGFKAYLPLENGASAISLRFGDEGTTEIETSTLNTQPSTEVYDLQGRRVLNPTKGMYIVNGKKVVIK